MNNDLCLPLLYIHYNTYIIKHKDGTYELVFGKMRVEISNPKIECFKDIPIIEE